MGLFVLLVCSVFLNYKQYRDLKEKPDKVEVVTTVTTTERTDTTPELKEEKPVGFVVVPVRDVTKIPADSVPLPVSSDTLTMKGDSVEIPITQKVYEDSLYTASVSGYHQSLDSIKVRERIVTTRITETRTDTEFRRWNIGVVAGYGYAFNAKQLDWFVGVGVTLSILPNKKKKKLTAVSDGF